jgi:hypothetical protein
MNNSQNIILRALIQPTIDGSAYDFEAVAVPVENKQLKEFEDGKGIREYFYQVLKTNPENLVSERLDSGLPIFDNHPEMEDAGALFQLGITVGWTTDERGLIVQCKWGARADEALKADVKNGIVKTMSIEGSVYEYEVIRTVGEVPIYNAILWEPVSLSFAPVPNDIGAQIEVKRAIQKQIEIPKIEVEETKYKLLTNKF